MKTINKEALLFLGMACLSDVFCYNDTYNNTVSAGKEET